MAQSSTAEAQPPQRSPDDSATAQSSEVLRPVTISSVDEDLIPPLDSLAPAIFVPLQKSLFEPFQSPQDRVAQLKHILEKIDHHSEAVKKNLLFLFERERRRILQEAKIHEAIDGVSNIKTGVSWAEADAMIGRMTAPPVKGKDYNKPSPFIPAAVLLPDTPMSWRERAMTILMGTVERAVADLDGYDAHIQTVKDHYKKALERELAIGGQRSDGRG